MIKKSIFEEELIDGMHRQLIKQAVQQESDNLEKAADYLNSAAEIFEDVGMNKSADQILIILAKIAQKHQHKNMDRHTKNLTSEKMMSNLKDHGTVFNLSDDGQMGNLNVGEDALEVSDNLLTNLHDFEDEID